MQHPDPTADSSAMLRDLFDALVRCSLERIEAERIEAERNKGGEVVTDAPGLLDRRDAAKYLGVGMSKFDELRKRDLTAGVDLGGALRFARTDLDKYIAKLKRRS